MQDLILVKVDGDNNDLGSEAVNGFPTIKLFLMNDKLNPIQYIGERKASLMKEFLSGYIRIDLRTKRDEL